MDSVNVIMLSVIIIMLSVIILSTIMLSVEGHWYDLISIVLIEDSQNTQQMSTLFRESMLTLPRYAITKVNLTINFLLVPRLLISLSKQLSVVDFINALGVP